nr:hypothetical protein [Sinorhizobium saheli]
MKRQTTSDWAWRISHCNGTRETGFHYAPTLEGAKSAVLAGIQEWFRQAGFH